MSTKQHVVTVVLLVCLSSIVQAVVLWRCAVPAIDAVRFVGVAQAIDARGVLPAIRSQREEPLFPLVVWAVHAMLEPLSDGAPSLWALSAQAAATAALVLCVVPVYFIAWRLVGPAAAVVGTVLFFVLPEVCRLGAEGISDSTHLLWFALAFGAMVQWWCGSPRPRLGGVVMLLAGLATAVAALARAEAVVLSVALVLTVLVVERRHDGRQSWTRCAVGLAGYALGMAAVLAPYCVAMGATTPHAALARVLGRAEVAVDRPAALPSDSPVWQFDDGRPMAFPAREPERDLRRRGLGPAALRWAECLASAFGYVAGLAALVGWWSLRHAPARPVDRFVQVFFVVFSVVVLVHTSREGYLSPRHLAPLVVVCIGCSGLGVLAVGDGVAAWLATRRAGRGSASTRSPALVALLVVALAAGYLVVAFRPLHIRRAAWRDAGLWLAAQSETTGAVLDTRGWTALYSGRRTYQYDQAKAAFCDPRLAFVVVTKEERDIASDRAQTLRHWLSVAGRPLTTFGGRTPDDARRSTVVIYQWDSEKLRQVVDAKRDSRAATPSLENREGIGP